MAATVLLRGGHLVCYIVAWLLYFACHVVDKQVCAAFAGLGRLNPVVCVFPPEYYGQENEVYNGRKVE